MQPHSEDHSPQQRQQSHSPQQQHQLQYQQQQGPGMAPLSNAATPSPAEMSTTATQQQTGTNQQQFHHRSPQQQQQQQQHHHASPSSSQRRFLLLAEPSHPRLAIADVVACQNLELFEVTQQDMDQAQAAGPTNSKDPSLSLPQEIGQVGVRCINCSYQLYPESIDHIGTSVRMITEQHLVNQCTMISPQAKETLSRTIAQFEDSDQGQRHRATELANYCIDVCRRTGVVDRLYPSKSGIAFGDSSPSTNATTTNQQGMINPMGRDESNTLATPLTRRVKKEGVHPSSSHQQQQEQIHQQPQTSDQPPPTQQHPQGHTNNNGGHPGTSSPGAYGQQQQQTGDPQGSGGGGFQNHAFHQPLYDHQTPHHGQHGQSPPDGMYTGPQEQTPGPTPSHHATTPGGNDQPTTPHHVAHSPNASAPSPHGGSSSGGGPPAPPQDHHQGYPPPQQQQQQGPPPPQDHHQQGYPPPQQVQPPPPPHSGQVVPPPPPNTYPFFQDHTGAWMCRYCSNVHPQYRDPGSYWSTPNHTPPPSHFLDQHLSMCRSYHHQMQHQVPPGWGPQYSYHHGHYGGSQQPGWGQQPQQQGHSPHSQQSQQQQQQQQLPPPSQQQQQQQGTESPQGHQQHHTMQQQQPPPPTNPNEHSHQHYQYPPPPPHGHGPPHPPPHGHYPPHHQQHGGPPHHGSSMMPPPHHMVGSSAPPTATTPHQESGSHGGSGGPSPQSGAVPSTPRSAVTPVGTPRAADGSDNAARLAIDHLVQSESVLSMDSRSSNEPTDLVLEEDKLLLTDYFFHLMKQLRLCRFSESDRKTRGGKRENIAVGYGGLQCVHCAEAPNSRKFFWSNVDRLANSFAEIPGHILKCRRCPAQTKQALLELKLRHPDQMSRLPRGSQKVFFRRMWRRLHDSDPLQPSPSQRQQQLLADNKENHDNKLFNDEVPSPQATDVSKTTVETIGSMHTSPGTTSDDSTGMQHRTTGDAARALAASVASPSSGPISPSSRIFLAISEDKEWLSDMDCFIRRQLEVFCATEEDVAVAQSDRKYPVNLNQIGIRCVHCALSKDGIGARGTAVAYPYSISGIYESVREFQRLHLEACSNLPCDIKDKLSGFKGSASLSSVLRKYYVLAAKALGLYDTPDGIRSGAEAVPIGSSAAFAFSEGSSRVSDQLARVSSAGSFTSMGAGPTITPLERRKRKSTPLTGDSAGSESSSKKRS